MIILDLAKIGVDSLMHELGADTLKSLDEFANHKSVDEMIKLAENGSPEAQTLIGMLYEKSIYFEKNLVTAAAYYHRAFRLDSQKSPYLLWQLSKSEEFWNILQSEVDKENAEAQFVWYGMNSIDYNNQLMVHDAINLLQKSVLANYIPAMIELGLNLYTGRDMEENQPEAIRLWEFAASSGSAEAKVRLLTAAIYSGETLIDSKAVFKSLEEFAQKGSVLAQVALAYCYEEGIGTAPSKSEVVKYYRLASNRGSQYAYRELQRLYDEIRPDEPEFRLN
jgi:TPR repeat protein